MPNLQNTHLQILEISSTVPQLHMECLHISKPSFVYRNYDKSHNKIVHKTNTLTMDNTNKSCGKYFNMHQTEKLTLNKFIIQIKIIFSDNNNND